jgi:hypothetical protein
MQAYADAGAQLHAAVDQLKRELTIALKEKDKS